MSINLNNMPQIKKYAENNNGRPKSSNIHSATPYKRKYGIDLLLEVDPFFLEVGELESAMAEHQKLSQLLEGATVLQEAHRKDFAEGTVVSQTAEGYFVNIKRKYDAFVPLAEGDGLTIGRQAEFYVISGPDKNGIVTMSFNMARGWRKLEAAQGTGEIFTARAFAEAVTRRTQKSAGLRIAFEEGDLKGIRGFIPNGEIARNTRSKDLVGTSLQLTVIKAESQHGGEFGNLILSHKEAQSYKDEISFNSMQTRTIVEGHIIGLIKASPNDTKMSALVQLQNGLISLLHRSETVEAQDSLADMYKVGDQITAAVSHIDHTRKRIGLSLKLAAQMNCLSHIAPNSQVDAKILREVVYGYFASIGSGLEGLIHNSDLALVNGRSESFKPGEITSVVILSYEEDGTRLALGRKQLFEQQ
jgi:ribosomal protein S1